MENTPQLESLLGSLAPEELDTHADLAPIYRAASAIAISSYNGRINTSPVEDLDDANVPMVQKLLNRFADDRGFIRFPVMHYGRADEVVISGDAAENYKITHGKDPYTKEDITYFTSFNP